MSTIRMTPILAASLNVLALPKPHTTSQIWQHAEQKALAHCEFCRAHGFTPADAYAPFGTDPEIKSWAAAAEGITIAFANLHTQLDCWLAGGIA